MITRLTNMDNVEITQQQAAMSDMYWKQYIENNLLKKEEFFIEQKLSYTVHYKTSSETVQDILAAYDGIDLVIKEIIMIGSKRYIQQRDYSPSGILEKRSNLLYDENNDLIAKEEIDIVSNLPIYNETIKYYFNRQLDPKNELFECSYNEDGTLDGILYNAYEFQESMGFGIDGIPGESDIETLRGLTGLSEEGMTYYLTADVLPT